MTTVSGAKPTVANAGTTSAADKAKAAADKAKAAQAAADKAKAAADKAKADAAKAQADADKAKTAAADKAKAFVPTTAQMTQIIKITGDGKSGITKEQLDKKSVTVNADSFVLNTLGAATAKEMPLTAADKKFLTTQVANVKTQADTINYMVNNWDVMTLGKKTLTADSIKTVEALDGKTGISEADKTIGAYISADNKQKAPQQDVEDEPQADKKKPTPELLAGDVSTQSLRNAFLQVDKSGTNNVTKAAVDTFDADQTKLAKILFTAKDAKLFDPKYEDVTTDLLNRTHENINGADQLKSKFTTLSAGDVMKTGRLDTLGTADLDIADANSDGKITQAELTERGKANEKNAKILTAQVIGLDVNADGVVNVNGGTTAKDVSEGQSPAQAKVDGLDAQKLTQVVNFLTSTPGKTSVTQADIASALASREAYNAVFKKAAGDNTLSESDRSFAQSRLKSNETFNEQLKYLQTNWAALSGGSQTLSADQIRMLSAADGQMGGISDKDLMIGKTRSQGVTPPVATPVAKPTTPPTGDVSLDSLVAYYNRMDTGRTGQVSQEQLDRRLQSQQAGVDLIAKLKANPAYADQAKTLETLGSGYTRGVTNSTLLQQNYYKIAATDNQFGVLSGTDLQQIDTNHDGTLSQAEIDAQQKKSLAFLTNAMQGFKPQA